MWVTVNAMAASPLAANALPPLKPNQPTQSIAAPATVSVMLCGGCTLFGKPCRDPSTTAATRAAVPAVIWTTVPPAKSMTPTPNHSPNQPSELSMPPPQTQWAMGA